MSRLPELMEHLHEQRVNSAVCKLYFGTNLLRTKFWERMKRCYSVHSFTPSSAESGHWAYGGRPVRGGPAPLGLTSSGETAIQHKYLKGNGGSEVGQGAVGRGR